MEVLNLLESFEKNPKSMRDEIRKRLGFVGKFSSSSSSFYCFIVL